MKVFQRFELEENIDLRFQVERRSKRGFFLAKTPAFEQEECNITEYLKFDQQYNDIIQEFNEIMNESFPSDKGLFNKNIKTLILKPHRVTIFNRMVNHFKSSVVNGTYSEYNNEIQIKLPKESEEDVIRSVFMHELIHLSASKNEIFGGFEQANQRTIGMVSIGRGVNEGYTEKLNQEYFSQYVDHGVYPEEIVLAGGIERIVGKEKMQKLYFDADLSGLVTSINHYVNDKEKVLNLLHEIDILDNIKSEVKREDKYRRLREEIAGIYSNKLTIEKDLELISEEEYERKKFFYIDRYIASQVAYSDNVKIKEMSEVFSILDGSKREVIRKDSVSIKFKPDIVAIKQEVSHEPIDFKEMVENNKSEKVTEIKEMLKKTVNDRINSAESNLSDLNSMFDNESDSSNINSNKATK